MRDYDLYARLELITTDFEAQDIVGSSKSSGFWEQFKANLSQAGHSLLKYFCGSNEPRISPRRDRQGNPYFVAYDPMSREQHTFSTEEELRTWLDQRYYL